MSTHSRELTITSCVFVLVVVLLSYLITLKQSVIETTLLSYRERVGLHREQTKKVPAEANATKTTWQLGRDRIQGAYVVSASGAPIKLNGINWSGFETSSKVVGGLDRQDYRNILNAIHKAGFNVVRLPFSNAMVEHPVIPQSLAFSSSGRMINQDLQSLNSLEIMDKVVAYAGGIGLRIILDNHRSSSGGGPQENGLWFTDDFPEVSWIDDWLALARRYKGQNSVLGFDLRNEPHSIQDGGACWSCGGERDWHSAAERVGNLILAEDSSRLIVIEGVDTYGEDSAWWGGNLEGVKDAPVRLSLPDHVIYSAHEYGPVEHSQPWFNSRTNASSLQQLWHRRWAFIEEQGLAPVYVGEFGTPLDAVPAEGTAGSQAQWFSVLVEYLAARPQIGWSYWSANAEDHYSFFQDDYIRERPDSTPLRRLIALDRESVWPLTINASRPERTIWEDQTCWKSGVSSNTGTCVDPSPSELMRMRQKETSRNSQVARNVDRATQNAIRTLPGRSTVK